MKTPQTRKIKKPIGLAIRSRVRAGDRDCLSKCNTELYQRNYQCGKLKDSLDRLVCLTQSNGQYSVCRLSGNCYD